MAGNSILDRFRPIGAPGPGIAGVPNDRLASADELAPVFAALEGDVAANRQLVEHAQALAQQSLADARRLAEALVADAQGAAAGIHAQAAARVAADAAAQDTGVAADAEHRATALTAAAEPKLADAARRLIESMVRGELGETR
jgi:hypothetical protein